MDRKARLYCVSPTAVRHHLPSRSRLLASAALALVLTTGVVSSAVADGGSGGGTGAGAGGAGTTGAAGGNATGYAGGGGGATGTPGGAGGSGGGTAVVNVSGAGGAGGPGGSSSVTPNGGVGAQGGGTAFPIVVVGVGGGGGGGGGGFNGAGGNGGNGGNGGGGGGGVFFSYFNGNATGGGGGGGGAGGAGLISSGSSNNTAVTGGAGGNGGNGGAAVYAMGSAVGGNGGNGGAGGAGLISSGATFTNSANVTGGVGGAGGNGGQAGFNLGTATGGSGGAGGAGGAGVIAAGASFTNTATITGGTGGAGGNNGNNGQGNGGTGGNGVQFNASGTFNNNGGNVTGGVGGFGNYGGNGGAGVSMLSGGTLNNNGGIIKGGVVGVGAFAGPSGGAGVQGNNLTINNTGGGTIIGGGSGIRFAGPGITGSNLTINNAGGTIQTGGQTNTSGHEAIILTGGTNYVGTGGTITGDLRVANAASFMPALPGSTVGTPLAVNGALFFSSTATYVVRITPTASDSVVATGAANIRGKVAVQAGAGTYRPRQYTIISAAGGVTGTFGSVSTNLAFLTPTLTYDAKDVFLNIALNGGNTADYRTAASTRNQFNVAAGYTNAAAGKPGGDGRKILHALNQLTVAQAQAAFDASSGEGITAAQNIAFRSAQLFNSAIFDQTTFYGTGGIGNSVTLTAPLPGFTALANPQNTNPEQTLAAAQQGQPVRELADLPSSKVEPAAPPAVARTWRVWGTGFGGVEHISGNAFPTGSASQENTIVGGALGVDYQLLPNYLVGIAVGGTDGTFQVPGRATSGETDGGHVAFYDLATFGKFYGASSSSFSYFGNKTTRFTGGFGGLASEQERGNFGSDEFRTRLEFGRHFDNEVGLGRLGALTPFIALELAELRSNGFNETAVSGPGLLGLNVQGQSIASVPAFVGARLQKAMALGNGMVLSPTLQVAYVHEFAPYRQQIGQIAALPGSVFLVDGARPARNAAQVKAGGELTLGPHAALFANFDGEFSGVNQLYAGKGGLRYLW